MSRLSGWLVVGLCLVAIGVLAWMALRDGGRGFSALGGGQLIAADSYAIADADTIIVTATTGEGAWTRITNVVETADSVHISIRVLRWPFAVYADVGSPITWTLDLARPIADRVVHDDVQTYHAVTIRLKTEPRSIPGERTRADSRPRVPPAARPIAGS